MSERLCTFGTKIVGVPVCGKPAEVITRSKSGYCRLHYRYINMRNRAQNRGLYVPTHLELIAATPADSKCPKCGVLMLWWTPKGTNRAHAASLQHLGGEAIAIWCMGCNSADAHSAVSLDVIFDLPEGVSVCCDCRKELPKTQFHESKINRSGVSSYCLDCDRRRKREYRTSNADVVAERQRRYYDEHRDELTAYGRNYYAANRERLVEYARERRRKLREAKKGTV